jgi:hypothetical protein
LSGVALVEFYIDDSFVGNATSFPYEILYHGKGKILIAIGYDNAGNSKMSDVIDLPLMSQQSQSLQSNPQVNPSPNQQRIGQQSNQLLQNLILRHQIIR